MARASSVIIVSQEVDKVRPARARTVRFIAGPVFQFPTATKRVIGTEKFALGPAAVVIGF